MDKSKKKGSKKGGKKIDPFSRKEWYVVRAPPQFFPSGANNQIGWSPVNRTQGTKLASDGLKGRVFEVCLADMKNQEEQVFRNIKLRAEEVEGRNVLTNFYGLSLTTDKLRSLIHKWAKLIECFVDVKTTDGYFIRVFAICFTKKGKQQIKKTAYAKTSRVKAIRRKMVDIITETVSTNDLKTVVDYFIGGHLNGGNSNTQVTLADKITKEGSFIFPIRDCYIRKVKVLKTPKLDAAKLAELYQGSGSSSSAPVQTTEEVGTVVERPEETTA
ncbi:40S ribosomal protein S3a [Tieghemostelium lacteum]|uniref:Small ribosomal subunit protein eS1 n=1 Tax=Tieghemostelium lacteum TaxID=361077 RepID=A0A152A1Q2_TIELA|nr:40S ribosomal protein S3a [Tieghemostelium lacteum]|eukprot:KYR00047.1 40S ribosomal protein S3a [Tieghemostelium lacteum]